jgi:hypothetical protein
MFASHAPRFSKAEARRSERGNGGAWRSWGHAHVKLATGPPALRQRGSRPYSAAATAGAGLGAPAATLRITALLIGYSSTTTSVIAAITT